MVGDDGTHAYYPWDAKGVFFKGWEDGNGPNSCPPLFNQMAPGEAYANYFKYWISGT